MVESDADVGIVRESGEVYCSNGLGYVGVDGKRSPGYIEVDIHSDGALSIRGHPANNGGYLSKRGDRGMTVLDMITRHIDRIALALLAVGFVLFRILEGMS